MNTNIDTKHSVVRLDDGLPKEAVRFAGDADPRLLDGLCEPRIRYVRISYEGVHMVMTPGEAQCFMEESQVSGDETPYTMTDTYLSEREFDDLPEFDGW